MKYLLQSLRIALVTLFAEILHYVIPLPIPASIYGMIVMFLLLETGILKLEKIKETGTFLLDIMQVLYVPAVVGVMNSFDMIRSNVLLYVLVIFAVTPLVMGISGKVTQTLIDLKNRKEAQHE